MVKDKKYYSQRATRFVRGIRPGPLPSHLLFSHASKNASNFALTALTIVWRLCNFFATLFTR